MHMYVHVFTDILCCASLAIYLQRFNLTLVGFASLEGQPTSKNPVPPQSLKVFL